MTATLTSPHGQAWLGTPNADYDSADVLANCQYNLPCGGDGTLSGTFPITHPGGTNLYAIAVCVGPYEGATSCPASGGLDAGIYVGSADIELSNGATPAASGLGGTLLNANASGTQELTFDASDPGGPGVYLVTAQIDGKTVYSGTPNNNEGKCVPVGSSGGTLMFDYSQPCRTSESVDLPINTTELADGQHTLKVTIEDAAGNTSVVYDGTITTKQPSNGSLGALPGPGTGGASLGASAGVGAANGTGASEAAQIRLGLPRRITRSVRSPSAATAGPPAQRAGTANRRSRVGRDRTSSGRWANSGRRARPHERGRGVHRQRAGGAIATDRGCLPRILHRHRVRGAGEDRGVSERRRAARHHSATD